MRQFLPILAVVSVCATVTPALALDDTVTITLNGEIERSCEVSPISAPDLSALAAAPGGPAQNSANVDFAFSCNAPYSMSVVSARGALTNASPAAIGKFAVAVPYLVSATLPFDTTGAIAMTNCASANLLAAANGQVCGTGVSAGKTSIHQQGNVKIDWEKPADPLLSGQYSDVLTIRISANL